MPPTSVSHPDLTAITVFLASTATPEQGGLPYLDAVLPAEDRLTATRVLRDLGALPPDAILYLLAQPLLDLASDHLRDRDLTARYEERFEVEDSDEWMAAMADYNREGRRDHCRPLGVLTTKEARHETTYATRILPRSLHRRGEHRLVAREPGRCAAGLLPEIPPGRVRLRARRVHHSGRHRPASALRLGREGDLRWRRPRGRRLHGEL